MPKKERLTFSKWVLLIVNFRTLRLDLMEMQGKHGISGYFSVDGELGMFGLNEQIE